jgi:hypothetical protein
VHVAPLAAVIESRTKVVAPFTRTEEIARKFHLGTSTSLIVADLHDVATAEHARPAPRSCAGGRTPSTPAPAADLGVDLAGLAEQIRRHPDRYRVRDEGGFGLLFDTRSHDVFLLEETEFSSLSGNLVGALS